MHLILDAILIAVVGICLAIGWRRGFIRSIRGLISMVLALVLVSTLAQPVGRKLDEAVVRPWAVERVIAAQGETVNADTPMTELDAVAVNQKISQTLGVNILGEDMTQSGQTVGEYVEHILITSGITVGIGTALATVILFAGTSILVWLAVLILTPIMKLPVLRQFNGGLGLLVGLFNAVVILCILATAVEMFGSTAIGGSFGPEAVEKTFIFKHVYRLNPISGWILK